MNNSRAYPYDDENRGSHAPTHHAQYPGSAVLPEQYVRGYTHTQGAGQYYVQPGNNTGDVYPRSITPMVPSSQHYPTNSSHARYYQTPGGGGGPSSPHLQQSAYHNQAPFYQQPLHRAEGQFIPTPSDLYSSYPPRQISVPPQSPTSDPYVMGQYPPPPPHIVPSSKSPEPRPGRLSIGKPGISPGSPISSSSGERFLCDRCGKTFSRSHDRKRHHETQHLPSPVVHRCRYCEKEFSRADSLKRHLDNGCDEMPS